MKPVTENFIAARNRSIPPGVLKYTTLSEFQLNGTLVAHYDLSTFLKGGLPIIDKEVEVEMNNFITGELTLKFHDPDKTLDDIINQPNRKFGLKVLLNFEHTAETPEELVSLDILDNVGSYNSISNDGTYSHVAVYDYGLRAYSFNNEELVLEGYINESGHEADVYCNSGFIFSVAQNNGYLRAHTFDGSTYTKVAELSLGSADARAVCTNDDGTRVFVAFTNPNVVKAYSFNGTTFVELDSINMVADAEDVCWDGTNLIVANTTRGVTVLSFISDTLAEVDNYYHASIGTVYEVDTDGTYIYSGSSAQVLSAYELSGGVLSFLASADIFFSSHAVRCQPPYIFSGHSDNLYAFTFNGTVFALVDALPVTDWIYGIWTDSRYIYLANRFDGIHLCALRSIYGNPFVLFDGMVDISQARRFGRNTLSLTAQTWEKEFEHHNAELVVDTENIPFRNICGVIITEVSGGRPGMKTVKYTYKETEDDKLYELQYENGPSRIFEEGENQLFSLYNETGDQHITGYFSTSKALETDAEDIFIVGENLSINNIGYWYQAIDIPTLVGKLFDRSTIEIVTRLIDVNEEIGILQKDEFMYFHKDYFGASGYLHGVGAMAQYSNKIVSHGKVFVARNWVYNYEWNKDTLEFTKTFKFNCVDYLFDTKFVEKILYDEDGNKFLVCVGWIAKTGNHPDREFHCCCGVIKTDPDGNYIEHWDDGDLTDNHYIWIYPDTPHRYVLAKSFHWCVRDTTPLCDRNRLGFIALHEALTPLGQGYTQGVHAIAFNIDTRIVDDDLYANPGGRLDFGQGAIIIWDVSGAEIGSFHGVCFHYDDGKVYAFTQSQSSYDTKELDSITLDDDVWGQFQYNYIESGFHTRYALYSNPRDVDGEKQIFLVWNEFEKYPTETINRIFSCLYIETKYPITILNYYPMVAYGWSLDENDNAESIVKVTLPEWDLPEIEILKTGFAGDKFRVSGSPYKYSDVWMGIAVAGYSTTLIAFAVSNISKNLIETANFSDMNVREAINEIGCLMCYWKRPERDKALFYSRGNYNGTFKLENSLYKSNYIESKTRPYIGVEVVNSLDDQYKYRYPDTFDSEEGEVFKLSNRLIYPLNGYVIAKLLAEWLLQIKTEAQVNGFFLIELEELDKIEWMKYHVDGSPDEQVDCVLIKASYDDKTKLVKMRMVKLEGYPFKSATYKPDHYGGS